MRILLPAHQHIGCARSSDVARNTTRWPDAWLRLAKTTPTLTATVSGTTVTFGGTGGSGQVAAVIADTASAAWRLQATDTPHERGGGAGDGARQRSRGERERRDAGGAWGGAADRRGWRRTSRHCGMARRQLQAFRVTAWCADPATRDAVGSAIDSALSGIDFVGLADGTSGRLRYLASMVSDRWEDATLYRRELTYTRRLPDVDRREPAAHGGRAPSSRRSAKAASRRHC